MKQSKTVQAEYTKVRAARPALKPGEKPPLILPLPREIAKELDIQLGETFAVYVDEDNKSIKLVRPKI